MGYVIRTLIAVVAVVVFNALLPPVSRLIGFSLGGDLLIVVRIVIAVLALWYIFFGRGPSWTRPAP